MSNWSVIGPRRFKKRSLHDMVAGQVLSRFNQQYVVGNSVRMLAA